MSDPTTIKVPAVDERPTYASWSQLSTYAQCGEKFKLRYLDRVPAEPQGAFIGGRALHSAIEWGEPQTAWSDDGKLGWVQTEGLRLFDAEVEEAGGDAAIRWSGRRDRDGVPNEGLLWWRHQIPVYLKHWALTRRLDDINGMRMLEGGTEMEVRVNLPSGRMVVVRIDAAMFEDGDERVIIRDWKAGRPGGAEIKQLAIYAWGIQQGPGWTVEVGEFAYLRQPALVHRHELAHLIPHVPAYFEKYATGLERDIFPVEPNTFCISCPVRAFCPHGQRVG